MRAPAGWPPSAQASPPRHRHERRRVRAVGVADVAGTARRGSRTTAPAQGKLGIAHPAWARRRDRRVHDRDSPPHLGPIGDLDPVTTVPLTDAGLTPYHAIKRSSASSAPIVRSRDRHGGLGHVGIQRLRHLSPARSSPSTSTTRSSRFAREVGAHETVLSNADAAANVRKITGSAGAALVLDSWVCAADARRRDRSGRRRVRRSRSSGRRREVRGPGRLLHRCVRENVASPYWGSRSELIELIDLAHQGVLDIAVERFALDDGVEAYRRLAAGTLRGRAVVVP